MAQQQILVATGAAGAAAAQTATVSLPTPMGGGPLSLYVVFDVTVFAGTSLTLALSGFDPVSGKFWGFTLTPAIPAVVATGTAVYALGLGIGAAAGGVTAVASLPVPPAIKIAVAQVAITQASYTVA